MKWINRVGIILDFLSFWFVAPEVIGFERLKLWDDNIQSRLKDKSFTHDLARASLKIMTFLGLAWLFFIAAWGFEILKNHNFLEPNLRHSLLFFVINLIAYIIVVGIIKLVSKIIEPIGHQFVSNIFRPFLKILERDETISRKWILVGAGLYVIGFLLQFVSTFWL